MSWGFGPWGVTPWGATFTLPPVVTGIALILAEPVRENVVRLTFDTPIYFSRWHDPPDAAFVDRYAISADPTAIGIDGEPSRPVLVADVKLVPGDGTQIDVWLDRAMSPTGSQYTVTVTNLKSSDLTLDMDPDQSTWTFLGVHQGLPVPGADLTLGNRDFANPQMPGVGVAQDQLGHFMIDDLGDYGIDQGLVSYKKRVFRRLTTRKGSFRHLPGYGVSIPQSAKKMARANLTDSIAADAEDQVRQEPETKNVSVVLTQSPDDPSLFIYKVTARTTIGDISDYTVPVPI